jgi:hypothetical protein
MIERIKVMKTYKQEQFAEVIACFNVEKERKEIKIHECLGRISIPLLFSFSSTLGTTRPSLNKILSDIQNIKTVLLQEIQSLLPPDIQLVQVHDNISISIVNEHKLDIFYTNTRLESETECLTRLVHIQEQLKLKKSKEESDMKEKQNNECEYAEYTRLKHKFEHNITQFITNTN